MPDCRKTPLCNVFEKRTLMREVRGTSLANILRVANDLRATPIEPPLTDQFDVMIIADYAKMRDQWGAIPLQDETGRYLAEFCRKANINPARTYVTYIFKCLPAKGKPSVKEINQCREVHLFAEIEAVNPKVIILLGNIACRAFNVKGGINSIRGTVFELPIPGKEAPLYKIVPTYDPGAFTYRHNPRLEQSVVEDYKLATMIVNNRTPEASEVPEWTLIDTLDKVKWLVEQLHTDKFSCDTESIELPWYRNHILCMSFCWGYPGKSAVLPFYKHQDNSTVNNDIIHKWTSDHFRAVRESLRTVLENPDIEKVFHNYKYDANVILKWLDIKVKGFVRDTMIFHHLLNEEGSHKLEDLAIEEFRYGDYSKKIKAIVGTGKKLLKTYDYIPDTDLWPYAATDAEASYRLDDTYTRHLQAKAHLWKLYVEESEPLLKALVKSEWYGHKIDVPLIDVLKKEYTDRQETLLAEMKALTNPEFKPLSNPQLVKAFIDLGLEGKIKNFKAVSGYTADKKVLGEIQDEVPLANKVLEYRTNRKIISTYLENAKVDVDDDGRIRYSWMPLTMTARLSCRFFHQIPKVNPIRKKQGLPNIRDLFIAEPGYSLVCGDYKQIELYILGIESQDDEMLKIMRDPNGDLHAASTYEFIHKVWPEYTEEMAKGDKFNRAEVGKRINFGLAYGSKGFSLVETGKWRDDKGRDHPFTWEMLEEGLEAWKKRFKGIGKYLENVPALARNHGGIVLNCFGRERRLGSQLNLENKHKREKAEREAVNFPIQSAAAALTNRTIGIMDRVIDNFIVERKLREGDIRLVNTVHDSIAYEVKNQLVEWFKETLKTIGERPIPELGNQSFEMEIGSGATWSIAEED